MTRIIDAILFNATPTMACLALAALLMGTMFGATGNFGRGPTDVAYAAADHLYGPEVAEVETTDAVAVATTDDDDQAS